MSELLPAVRESRLHGLVALRDRIATQIDGCDSARDVAALSRQLVDVLAEIEALAPAESKGTPLDELASRRSSRGASAPRQDRPAR